MEKQNNIIRVAKQQVNTTIPANLWATALKNKVSWQRALEIGIYAELIDKKVIDLSELPTNYNYFTREIARLKKEKVELLSKLQELGDNKENGEKC